MEETENRVVRRQKITKDEGTLLERKIPLQGCVNPEVEAGIKQLFRDEFALLSIHLGVGENKRVGSWPCRTLHI